MTALTRRVGAAAAAALLWCGLALQTGTLSPALADNALPFKDVLGRWMGEGHLGVRNGKSEAVKCRVTYFLPDQPSRLQQNIRCASASGNIEVKSAISHDNGVLKGTWNELVHNMSGELNGTINPSGFRVFVKGADLSASMDIIVKGARQIIEIQFQNSTFIGLTLVLTKG